MGPLKTPMATANQSNTHELERTVMTDEAKAKGPQGPNSLEASMTPEAWSKLMGEIQGASKSAEMLGSEGGVQALLQQQSGKPVSGFDAALVNGAGGKGFLDASKQGGKLVDNTIGALYGAGDKWSKLTGDVDTARRNDELAKYRAQVEADNKRGEVDLAPKDPNAMTPEREAAEKTLLESAAPFLSKAGPFKDQSSFANMVDTTDPYQQKNVQQMVDQLGMTKEQLKAAVAKMTPGEYVLFITVGYVPPWMETGKDKKGNEIRKGVPRGWSGFASDYVDAISAGTDPKAKPYLEAFNMALAAVIGLAGGPAGAAAAAAIIAANKATGT
jgi:hypothetical protein